MLFLIKQCEKQNNAFYMLLSHSQEYMLGFNAYTFLHTRFFDGFLSLLDICHYSIYF